jgi:acetolactate synthase-1/2/3 large subunit
MNVAEGIARALVAEDIRLAAGIFGQQIGRLAEAIAGREEISLMYVRQERVALDICDGFARACGRPAVVFTDSGPAAANLMGGLVNSWGDATPVLFFAGHNDRLDMANRTTKELPFLEIFKPVSKWAALVNDPSQIGEIMRRAFMHLRTGRPGPVVIGLPDDVSGMAIETFDYQPVSAQPRIRSGADPAAVAAAVDLIGTAERPYLYVGAGVLVSEATADLVRFAELLSLPVATTLNGKSAFPEDHPLALGIGGFVRAAYSTLPAAICAEEADLIVTIGCGFKRHATEKRPTVGVRHIQVDVEPSELNRHHLADVALLGDAQIVLRQFVEAARARLPASRLSPVRTRLEEIERLRARWEAVCEPLLDATDIPINPFRVTRELNRLVDPAATIVLHDAGTVRGTTAQHYLATTPRGFLGFGVESAMGWSVGAALGAKKACPDKLVVAVVGDEAFAETALDVETSVRNDAPVLIIVKNNRSNAYADQSGGKKRLGLARFQRGIDIPALATALGAKAYRIERPDDIAATLGSAIRVVKGGSTAVVDVVTTRMNASLHTLWEHKS